MAVSTLVKMSDWDSQRFDRARQIPDLEHRLPTDATSSGRPQRSGLKILIGVGIAIVAIFVALAVFDDGGSNNPSEGAELSLVA